MRLTNPFRSGVPSSIRSVAQVSWARLEDDGKVYRYEGNNPDLSDPALKVILVVYCILDIRASGQVSKLDAARNARVKWLATDLESWAHVVPSIKTETMGKVPANTALFAVDPRRTEGYLPLELNEDDRATIVAAISSLGFYTEEKHG